MGSNTRVDILSKDSLVAPCLRAGAYCRRRGWLRLRSRFTVGTSGFRIPSILAAGILQLWILQVPGLTPGSEVLHTYESRGAELSCDTVAPLADFEAQASTRSVVDPDVFVLALLVVRSSFPLSLVDPREI